MIVPFSSFAVIAFGCGQEVFIHETFLRRYKRFTSPDSSVLNEIRIDGPYDKGGYLIVHWLYRQDLRHLYAGLVWSVEACQDHLHTLVEAYAMAIRIGLEDFANEIPHLAKELFFYRLPRAMVRKTAIQLASHDLQRSGLMWLTLEERESRRFDDLEDEIEEEMEEEEEEGGGGPATSEKMFFWYWDFDTPQRTSNDVRTCRWHEHNHTIPCVLQGTGHGQSNPMNAPGQMSNR